MKLLLAIFLFIPTVVLSQDFFSFLSPHSPSTSLDIQGMFTPTRDLDNGPHKSQVMYSSLGVGQKLYEDEKNSISISGRYQKLDLNSQGSLVRDYYNIQGTVSYRRLTEQHRFWSASLSYGSASDQPFKNGRDGTIGANYLRQISDKWFVIGNYSNNRTFLNNVPLPGFFYVKEMTRQKALIIGFPIIYWMTPLTENWSFRYFGVLPWTHKLRLLYTKWRFVMPYFGYEQNPVTFFNHDRAEKRERFFWFEKRVALGVEGGINRNVRFDLSSGLAFDREFFEARNFGQTKNNLFKIENGYFIALTLRLSM